MVGGLVGLGGSAGTWSLVRAGLVALALLIVGLAAWIGLDDRFYIQTVDVRGAHRVAPETVFSVSELPGLHILWARSDDAEQRILAALPSLSGADVRCRLPARCLIEVVERQPSVVWESEEGRWWIDAEGQIFPWSSGATGCRRIQGPLPRTKGGRLAAPVQEALDDLWVAGVDQELALDYVLGRGFSFVDERGWRVVLGEGDGMAQRLRLLDGLTAHLLARGAEPTYIDVRFVDAPFYSLTNEWAVGTAEAGNEQTWTAQ
jgi:hypothetical protein